MTDSPEAWNHLGRCALGSHRFKLPKPHWSPTHQHSPKCHPKNGSGPHYTPLLPVVEYLLSKCQTWATFFVWDIQRLAGTILTWTAAKSYKGHWAWPLLSKSERQRTSGAQKMSKSDFMYCAQCYRPRSRKLDLPLSDTGLIFIVPGGLDDLNSQVC